MTPELQKKLTESNFVCVVTDRGDRRFYNTQTNEILTAVRVAERLDIPLSSAKDALETLDPVSMDHIKLEKKKRAEQAKAEYLGRSIAFAKSSLLDSVGLIVMVNSTFYVQGLDGNYSQKSESQIRPYLDSLYAKNPNYNFDTYMSQVKEFYTANPVTICIPRIAGQKGGVNLEQQLLVERTYTFPMVANTDDCPAFKEFVDKAFGPEQAPYFLAWASRMLKSLNGTETLRGHAVYLVGDAGTCKSQCINICGLLADNGPVGDIGRHLIGEGNQFNATMASHCVLACDDKKAPTLKNHEEYATKVKNMVTEIYRGIEWKGVDSVMVNPKTRLMLGVNNDAEGYKLLPPPQASVLGKVMIFQMNHPNMSLEKYGNLNDPIEDEESVFYKELPFIRKYLLDYQTPVEIMDKANSRFGVLPYHSSKVKLESVVLADGSPLYSALLTLTIPRYHSITFMAGTLYQYLEVTKQLHSSGITGGVRQIPHLLKSIMKWNTNLTVEEDAHLKQALYTLVLDPDAKLPSASMRDVLNVIDRVQREQRDITVNNILLDYKQYSTYTK